MAIKKVKTIEEKYKELSEVDHILFRPGMYVGSIKEESMTMFLYNVDEAKMQLQEVTYVPAMLKIIDEVISNSCDEFRRETNMGLTTIEVTVDPVNFCITVRDNGGIPVVKHKGADCYLTEFIFGRLRTSSNYDDTESRDVIGTNGVGSALANVFSKKFTVETADSKHKILVEWQNNMKECTNHGTPKPCKDHYTQTTLIIDADKFELDDDSAISNDFINIIEKRCIDAAAANPGLTVNFKHIEEDAVVRKAEWHFKTFEEYIELYSDFVDNENMISFSDKQKSVWIYPDNNINIGFVNGAMCSKGTHIRAVRNEINNAVANLLLTKHKVDIGPSRNVDNKYSLFCIFKVANPAYDSQLKDTLTTAVDKFDLSPNYKFSIPASFIQDICKSELVDVVLDWFKQKSEVEDQKMLRKLNKQAKTKLRDSEKFIDANSKLPKQKELWIFEGNSAKAGFRVARNPQTQAAYLLRGVILNPLGLSPSKIMANKELSDIITILGLQWGQTNDVSKLNFGKIVIATDADVDGSKIAGLLLCFFNLFPELFEAKMVCRSITPIITAIKGNEIKRFYKIADFKAEEKKLTGYKVLYNKGLGGQSNAEYKEMMQHPILHYFTKDEMTDLTIKAWFGKGIAKERKEMVKGEV